MKNLTLISIILITLSIFGCSKNDEPTPLDLSTLESRNDDVTNSGDSTSTSDTDENILSGAFSGSAHPTSGTASISNNVLKLHSDFKSDSGPDLYIYLAQDLNGNGFVNLGVLQNTSGEQTYAIPEGIDYSKNKYVLVWCKEYSVLFGSAEVME